MTSPVRSPAAAAGLPSATLPTAAGHTGRPTVARTAAKITAASTKFIPGPAKTMRKRAHSGFRANAFWASNGKAAPPSSGFSSPIIFT